MGGLVNVEGFGAGNFFAQFLLKGSAEWWVRVTKI